MSRKKLKDFQQEYRAEHPYKAFMIRLYIKLMAWYTKIKFKI